MPPFRFNFRLPSFSLSHTLTVSTSTLKFFCATHLLLTQLFLFAPCEGPSMIPTFHYDGDWLLADMLRHRRGRNIQVGDLVLYQIPLYDKMRGVKRIIGMPGDYVSMGTTGEEGQERMIQVPEGHCWVGGDNIPVSRDSRIFGPLPLALVQGKVVAKVLPWRDRGWMADGLEPRSLED